MVDLMLHHIFGTKRTMSSLHHPATVRYNQPTSHARDGGDHTLVLMHATTYVGVAAAPWRI